MEFLSIDKDAIAGLTKEPMKIFTQLTENNTNWLLSFYLYEAFSIIIIEV